MTEIKQQTSFAIQNWLISIAIMFFSFGGVIIPLVCIYSMPDKSVRPDIGAIYFIVSSLLLTFFLFLRWKKEKAFEKEYLSAENKELVISIKETISDKILKWLFTIYAITFAFSSISIALICIYTLPDKTVQPKVSAFFYLGGALVVGSFLFVLWKNYVSKQP